MYNEKREWKSSILKRDKYTCQMCGSKPRRQDLECHHILKKELYPEKQYDINNGICLCHRCHAKITGNEPEYEKYFVDKLTENK